MRLVVDLHSHSGASGGVGDISLPQVTETMRLKGIGVFGTGDCFHDGWLEKLAASLKPEEEGFFSLIGSNGNARFAMQSEIILTAPAAGGGRKGAHIVILVPSFSAARDICKLLDGWGVKRNIGRPFLTCESVAEAEERLFKLAGVAETVEIIPAHVLTPQGIYGSNNPITWMRELLGEADKLVHAVETGLSSDPEILALIPELDNRALISNSDCHCGALNRVGREYTILDVPSVSYSGMIEALRTRRVTSTVEFHPAEGRYFLTGHRPGKGGHGSEDFCYFSPENEPDGNVCPICGGDLVVGVLSRALALSKLQGEERSLASMEGKGKAPVAKVRQNYQRLVPLVEALAKGLGVKSISSGKVSKAYDAIVAKAGSEADFWLLPAAEAEDCAHFAAGEKSAKAVREVFAGNFTFEPLGYDGEYGELVLGKRLGWFGHKVVKSASK